TSLVQLQQSPLSHSSNPLASSSTTVVCTSSFILRHVVDVRPPLFVIYRADTPLPCNAVAMQIVRRILLQLIVAEVRNPSISQAH
ncbi:unnamed protein product, partial [Citrullus colocynthis]